MGFEGLGSARGLDGNENAINRINLTLYLLFRWKVSPTTSIRYSGECKT